MTLDFTATEAQLDRIEHCLGALEQFRIWAVQPDLHADRIIVSCDCPDHLCWIIHCLCH